MNIKSVEISLGFLIYSANLVKLFAEFAGFEYRKNSADENSHIRRTNKYVWF